MSLREILNQDCQELIEKQEKQLCFIFGSDQSGKIQKNKNQQRLLNKIEISYLLLVDTSREKILCTMDLPVPQCISLNDFTKKIDIFMGNWSRKLNIHKQYNFNLPKHKPLPWSCTKIDSFSSTANLCLASNLPEISAPELFGHIIGFFKHSILHQSFDFHPWKLTEKLKRRQEKCISIAKCKSKTLTFGEVKNFENESETEILTKEMDEMEESETTILTKEMDEMEESETTILTNEMEESQTTILTKEMDEMEESETKILTKEMDESETKKLTKEMDEMEESETKILTKEMDEMEESETKILTNEMDEMEESETKILTNEMDEMEESETKILTKEMDEMEESETTILTKEMDEMEESETTILTNEMEESQTTILTKEMDEMEESETKILTKEMEESETKKLTKEMDEMEESETKKLTKEMDEMEESETKILTKEIDEMEESETTILTREMEEKEESETTILTREMEEKEESETTILTREMEEKEESETKILTKEMDEMEESETTILTREMEEKEESETTILTKEMDEMEESETTILTREMEEKEESETKILTKEMDKSETTILTKEMDEMEESETTILTREMEEKEESETTILTREMEEKEESETKILTKEMDEMEESETTILTKEMDEMEESETTISTKEMDEMEESETKIFTREMEEKEESETKILTREMEEKEESETTISTREMEEKEKSETKKLTKEMEESETTILTREMEEKEESETKILTREMEEKEKSETKKLTKEMEESETTILTREMEEKEESETTILTKEMDEMEESETKKLTKEMDEMEESTTLKTSLCIKLQNSQLQQNANFGFSYPKKIKVKRNLIGNKSLLNFPKSRLNLMKRRINPRVFELAILEKQFTDRKIFLFNCKSLNMQPQFLSLPVKIQSQLIINKSNKNISKYNKSIKWVPDDDEDDDKSNSDKSQSWMIETFKATTSCCHDTEEDMIVDTSSEFTEKESVPVGEVETIDKCNFMSYLNNKKHYQITESHFFTDYFHDGKYTYNKARYANTDSEKRLELSSTNIKTFGLSDIYKYTPCKKSWTTLLINSNVQTIATHIEKLLTMFLHNSESIPYLPSIYNKNIISCSPHQHGFSSEYKTQKSIALGNKAQLSDKSLICVRYTSSCSNFKAIMNTRELDTNSRMVTYRSTAQLHEESLHVSALSNENRHIANIPDPPKSDSLKENLITASLNNLNEGGHSCNDVESKSRSFVSNDNNLSALSCIKIASDQNKNSAQFSAQMKSPVVNINCPEHSNPDYNCLINTAQDIHSISLKRKQSSFCDDDNIISAECESKSMKDCIPPKTSAEQDGDKAGEKDKIRIVENEQYNEYKVIKKPRLQLREKGNCFHNDLQSRTCSYEMEQDSRDQLVPEDDDQLSFPEESTSLYSNNGLHGNEHHGAFCWNSSLLPSYTDNMKDSLKECPVVLPLTTCNKPLRVGLSKRQKLPPLHPQAKKRRCMIPAENYTG